MGDGLWHCYTHITHLGTPAAAMATTLGPLGAGTFEHRQPRPSENIGARSWPWQICDGRFEKSILPINPNDMCTYRTKCI